MEPLLSLAETSGKTMVPRLALSRVVQRVNSGGTTMMLRLDSATQTFLAPQTLPATQWVLSWHACPRAAWARASAAATRRPTATATAASARVISRRRRGLRGELPFAILEDQADVG